MYSQSSLTLRRRQVKQPDLDRRFTIRRRPSPLINAFGVKLRPSEGDPCCPVLSRSSNVSPAPRLLPLDDDPSICPGAGSPGMLKMSVGWMKGRISGYQIEEDVRFRLIVAPR